MLRDHDGQATIELLALLPLLVVAALAGAAIVAYAAAEEHAGEAADAGALALLQDEDATAAARAALPDAQRAAATIHVAGSQVDVALPPPRLLRSLLPHLTATASADAGPEPTP